MTLLLSLYKVELTTEQATIYDEKVSKGAFYMARLTQAFTLAGETINAVGALLGGPQSTVNLLFELTKADCGPLIMRSSMAC